MKQTILRGVLVAGLVMAAGPASAANKEHQQLMADIRMLQEQAQQLQNLLGTLNDTIKAVNARLDDQANASRKAFADQKVIIDTIGVRGTACRNWLTTAISVDRSATMTWSGAVTRSTPPYIADPPLGRYVRARHLRSVDLPEPDGPSTATSSPAATDSETSTSAGSCRPPNRCSVNVLRSPETVSITPPAN